MKKIGLLNGIALALFCILQPASGEWISLGISPQSTAEIRVERADENGLRLHLMFSGFESEAVELAETDFQRLSFQGSGVWGQLGQPELPVLRKLVRLPEQSDWHWEIVNSDFVELSDYTLSPHQEGTVETPEGSYDPDVVFDETSYLMDRWFPTEPVELGSPIIMRDFRLGRLELRPIQYNPARKLLRVYRNLTVQIIFEGRGENPILNPRTQKSRVFSRLVTANVINPEAFSLDENDEVLGGYLFITPPSFQSNQWLTDLVEWKQRKGFPCTFVSTSVTGSSASQIKNYIQNLYNTSPIPPDYLVLVGDADQGMPTHYYPNTGDASDLPYTLLEGTDYFPDMLAGRLSVDSQTDLSVVCAKILNYEANPYTSDPSWFTRGLMVYDYSGSLSCKNTKERCRDLMLEHGYTTVEQVTNPPHYSGASYINPIINNGVTFVNYRGYGSYSCWSPPTYYTSNIQSLYNNYKLPVITSIVCGGGNFVSSSSDPCFGEGWIRYGSVLSPKGAVSFMGPTSLYTHTKWNNCIDAGIYQGIFEEGIGDFASALLRGKMELYYGMPNNQGPGGTTSSVECYFYIYNILGDPGLEMWTGVPATLSVTHPTSLPQGVNSFDLTVLTGVTPIEGALVCVRRAENDYQNTAWTDETGSVLMDLGDATAGSYYVTVTGHNLHTYMGQLTISQEAVALGIENYTVDDDMIGESSGDGDGQFNPGETIELIVTLSNNGSSQTATGVTGTVSSSDPYLTITQSSLTGPNAAPGATSLLSDDFNLILSPEAPHSHIVQVTLEASCSQGSWTNLINLPVVAPLAEALEYTIENSTGVLNPGEIADVTVTLLNSGGDPLQNCSGTLISPDARLTVTDNYGQWDNITPGNSCVNGSNMFTLTAAPDCPPGWTVPLQLIVNANSYADTVIVNFTVGEVTDEDPAGPDAYGYRCFDSRDLMYAQAPTYDWIEASTQPGQTTLNLPDYSSEDDKSLSLQLPFDFRYYGEDYDSITVCSNGWISMRDRDNYINFRNWNIPGAQGPPAMIAAFWDDLRMDYSGSSIHYWYDSANHRVVIEWKHLKTAYGYGYNTFEIILYDPAYYPTSTGDGEIVFQYQQFRNYDSSENYCTIGIENWQQSDGVKVTYANYYTAGSAVLDDGVALKFTTDIDYLSTAPDVEIQLTPYGTPIQIPSSGGSFDYNIAATNNEPTSQGITVWCDVTLPNGVAYGPVLGPVTVTLGSGVSINRDRTQAVPSNAPTGVYQYNAYAGAYPNSIWDSDNFTFTKLADGYRDIVNDWINDGEPFDNEALAQDQGLPDQFSLIGASPNPFNQETKISFTIPEKNQVRLCIYDVRGRKVAVLVDGYREAGMHEVIWNAANLSAGLYFVRFEARGFTAVQKMAYIK